MSKEICTSLNEVHSAKKIFFPYAYINSKYSSTENRNAD